MLPGLDDDDDEVAGDNDDDDDDVDDVDDVDDANYFLVCLIVAHTKLELHCKNSQIIT